jgi:hypothetical protein
VDSLALFFTDLFVLPLLMCVKKNCRLGLQTGCGLGTTQVGQLCWR